MNNPEVQIRVSCEQCEKDKNCQTCNDTKYITSWVPLQKVFTGQGTMEFKAVYLNYRTKTSPFRGRIQADLDP